MTKSVKLPTKKAQTTSKNKAQVKKAVKEKKDLLYIYPEGLEDKKTFRGNARRKRDSYIKRIQNAETQKDANAIKREAVAWAKEIFTTPPAF